jgi:hypothetical protein
MLLAQVQILLVQHEVGSGTKDCILFQLADNKARINTQWPHPHVPFLAPTSPGCHNSRWDYAEMTDTATAQRRDITDSASVYNRRQGRGVALRASPPAARRISYGQKWSRASVCVAPPTYFVRSSVSVWVCSHRAAHFFELQHSTNIESVHKNA